MSEALEFFAALDQRWMLAVLLLLIDAWAIGETWLSRARVRDRWLWTGIVLLCPIIGCWFWFVLGPKAPRRPTPL